MNTLNLSSTNTLKLEKIFDASVKCILHIFVVLTLEYQNKDHKNFYDNVNREFSMLFCINSYHSCLGFFLLLVCLFLIAIIHRKI